ncbi:hypothetical protein WDU94_013552 [Cyamophila willieti]
MDPLTPKVIKEIQENIDNNFKPLNYKKISEFDKVKKALDYYKRGSEFYEKGQTVSAYQTLYLFASWATMMHQKPEDEIYVKSMLKEPLKSCMNHLEKLRNEADIAEKLKEREEQLRLKELEEREKNKRLQELAEAKKKMVASSDSRLNNNAPSAVNLNKPSLYNGLMNHHDSDYIIKPEDKYEPTTPRIQTSLSCEELQVLLKDSKSSVLLIDCRSQNEFNASTVKTGMDNLINIPPEVNVRGLSARTLGEKLCERHKTLWDIRNTFDRIIMFDSFCKVNQGSLDTSLERLVMIIKEFDLNTKYKAPPVLLKGGFEAWHTLYPYYTTNPTNHKPAVPFTVPVPTNINTINYSSLLDDTPPSPPPSDPTPPPPHSTNSMVNGGEVLGSEMGYPTIGSGVRDSSEGNLGLSSGTNAEFPSSYSGTNPRESSSSVGGYSVDPVGTKSGPPSSNEQGTPSRVVKPMPRVDRSSKPSENMNGVPSQVRPLEIGSESPGAVRSKR